VTTIREAIKSCLETNWSLGTTPTFHDVLTEEDLQAVLAAKDDVVWIYPYQRSPYEVVNVNYRHRHEYYEIGVQSRTSDDEAEGFRDEVLRILTASGAITGVDMILPLWKTDLSDRKKHIYKHVITFDVVVLAETSSGSVTPSSTSNADLSQRTYVTISDESGTLPNSVQHANITSQSELHAPKLHAASHENGGSDEIDVSGLSGELADPQPPKAHASSHESGGSDELSLDASQITSGTIDSARLPTITDAMVNDDITLTNITQISNRDHGDLQGLGDDDHTQYYNAARHTKAVHDALGIDADTVDNYEAADLRGWKIVYDQTVSTATTTVSITGLDGDNDKVYYLFAYIVNGAASTCAYYLRCNNDSGTNYGYQYIAGSGSTASAGQVTGGTYAWFGYADQNDISVKHANIYAKSGNERVILTVAADRVAGTTVTRAITVPSVWSDTSTNITSLVVTASAASGIGAGSHILLWKVA